MFVGHNVPSSIVCCLFASSSSIVAGEVDAVKVASTSLARSIDGGEATMNEEIVIATINKTILEELVRLMMLIEAGNELLVDTISH